MLYAEFLALVQVRIYGGAIIIVLRFAIMLTRGSEYPRISDNRQWPLAALAALGVMGVEIPDEFGGGNAYLFHSVLAVEALSRVDPSIGVLVDVQNTLVINAVLRWGDDALKSRYLPRLASDTIGAYALSEASSGSDAFALKTRAVRHNKDFELTGRKLWITNAAEAELFIVFANVNPSAGYRGITAFIVERRTPGLIVGKKEDKLGIRASSTCELILDGCQVPAERVLGEVGKGYRVGGVDH